MNEVNNQFPQQEPQNQIPSSNNQNNKKSNNVLIICITVIIVAIIAAVTVYLLIQPKKTEPKSNSGDTPKQEETSNNTNKKDEPVKEVEVSNPNSYQYLIDRLGGKAPCGNTTGVAILEYLKGASNISNGFRLLNAFNNLKEQELNVKKTDQFYGLESTDEISDSVRGYKADDVEKEIKKIYGKDTIVDYKGVTETPYVYDITAKAYFMVGGFGCYGKTIQTIDKVTTKDKMLYIYVYVGKFVPDYDSKTETLKTLLFYDYVNDEDIETTNIKYVTQDEVEKKYIGENGLDAEQYLKNNKEKFTKYKYTFEKEDNNYIIKGLEKIK